MRLGIDLPCQDLASAGHRQGHHLSAQCFAGTVELLLDLGFGGLQQPRALGTRLTLRLFHDFRSTAFSLRNDLLRLLFGLAQLVCRTLLGQLLLVLSALGGSQTIGDALLALLERIDDRRPDELHTEPDEDDERDRLSKKRQINIHALTS